MRNTHWHAALLDGCHRGADGTVTIRALMLILEDVLSTIRTTGNHSCNLYPTRRARFSAVANLMAAFGALNNHRLIYFKLYTLLLILSSSTATSS